MFARLTALLAALLLAVLALVACRGGADKAGPREAPPAPTAAAPAAATATPPPDSVAADRAALVALYHATGGDDWHDRTNWLTGAPLGAWWGVTTDGDGRVTELNLITNRLRGSIPPELGSLTRLERLLLGGFQPPDVGWPLNRLSGPIPPELGMLAELKELLLVNNELSGPIPAELGNLVQLERLDLGENQLSPNPPKESARAAAVGCSAVAGTMGFHKSRTSDREHPFDASNEQPRPHRHRLRRRPPRGPRGPAAPGHARRPARPP